MKEKKQRLDIMLDIETCGLEPNAAWLSVAMIPFNMDGSPVEQAEEYQAKIELTSCFMSSMSFDVDTQHWWSEQDPVVKMELIQGEKKPVNQVAGELWNILNALSDNYDLVLWSQGSDFDFPKLEYCFRVFVGRKAPYNYWNKRDARTYVREMGVDSRQIERKGNRHAAADDCRHQIVLLQLAYQKLHEKD